MASLKLHFTMLNIVQRVVGVLLWKRKTCQTICKFKQEGNTLLTQATNPDAQVPKSDFHLGEGNLQNPAPPNATASAGEKPTWISEKIDCPAMKMLIVIEGLWPIYIKPERQLTVCSLIDTNLPFVIHNNQSDTHASFDSSVNGNWSTIFLLPPSSQTSWHHSCWAHFRRQLTIDKHILVSALGNNLLW